MLKQMLESFNQHCIEKFDFIIHGDLSIGIDEVKQIREFPLVSSVIRKCEADELLREQLINYPNCSYFRSNDIFGIKLFDPVLMEENRVNYMDCDILFYQKFSGLFALDANQSAFMREDLLSNFESRRNIHRRLDRIGITQISKVNAGIYSFPVKAFDLDFIEILLSEKSFLNLSNLTEQLIWSIMACRTNYHYFNPCQVRGPVKNEVGEIGVDKRLVIAHYIHPTKCYFGKMHYCKDINNELTAISFVRAEIECLYTQKMDFITHHILKLFHKVRLYLSNKKSKILNCRLLRMKSFKIEICNDVRDFAVSQNLNIKEIFPPKTEIRTIPHSLTNDNISEFRNDQISHINPRYLTVIPKARLIGSDGYLILPDGSFASELVGMHDNFILDHPVCSRLIKPKAKHIEGTCFSLMQWACRSYYHWMHDVLTRFYCVLEHIPTDIKWIVPHDINDNQRHTLKALGLDEKQFLFYGGKGNEHWVIEKLMYAPPLTITRFDSSDGLIWLRYNLFQYFHLDRYNSAKKKIYISRSKTRCRRLLNEELVYDLLRKYGYEKYYLEEMTIHKQAELFAQAESIIAPHGAGLTNLIFAPKTTRVLELFPSVIGNRTCYWSMADAIGMKYSFLKGHSTHPHLEADSDYSINLNDILRYL